MSDDFYDDDPIEEKTKRNLRNNLLTPLALIIAAVFFFQSTLAGNITLSSGTGIEFGQGVSQAVACSGSTNLIVTPRASFTNGAGSAGAHYFNSVTVSNIPTSCYGVDFIISAYGDSSSTPLALFNSTSTNAIVYDNDGTFLPNNRSTGMTLESGAGTFTAIFTTPVAQSSSVFKLTIQSSAHTTWSCAQGGACSVGNVGPGGGTIFYVALSPFACGPTRSATCTYLEAASTSGVNAWTDAIVPWSGAAFAAIGATARGTEIGTGYANTLAIVGQSGGGDSPDKAGTLSRAYRGPNNLSDWFLPSKDELNQLYLQRSNVGGFVQPFYWSSTENTGVYAWFQRVDGAYPYDKWKDLYVRAVRAF